MKELLIYQLEVACGLTLFYVFYKVILSRGTNLQSKRLFILFSSVAAFVLPALNIQFSLDAGESTIPVEYLTLINTQIIDFPSSSIPSNKTGLWVVLSVVWGIGFSVMVSRLLFSLFHVAKILREATKGPEGKPFKITNTNVQSFSFFKTIVLNTRHYRSEAMKYILAHERAHSDQYHSADVLFVEFSKTLQWFNPAAWLFARESIQNLEYLADKEVVNSMKNLRDYQMAIVEFAHHSGNKLLRTEFSKSNLKNRIIMMNQPNNQKTHIGKFILILPIVAVLFMSFSLKVENLDLRKEVGELLPVLNLHSSIIDEPPGLSSISTLSSVHNIDYVPVVKSDTLTTTNDRVFSIADELPRPATGDLDSYLKKINADLIYPEKAKEKGIEGKVYVQFIVQKDGTLREVKAVKGIEAECDKEAVRVIKNGPLWIPAVDKGEKVNIRMILPVHFKIPGPRNQNTESRLIKGTISTEDGKPVIGANVIIKGTHIGTVSDMEGRFTIKTEAQHSELVFASTSLKSQVVGISNNEDYNIIMKAEDSYVAPPKSENSGITIKASGENIFKSGKNPLILVDGKVVDNTYLRLIDPQDIESINVLKNEKSAIAEYGEKGKNGVIEITLKDGAIMKKNESKSKKVDPEIFVTGYAKTGAFKIQENGKLISDLDNPPLIIKDGVEIAAGAANAIDPENIGSVDVLKGDAAKKLYGKKGTHGVIIIKMKE